ncbi:MAG: 2-hydroxyacyl-CoA dehydratase family protein [Dehalococcoidia bacterium]
MEWTELDAYLINRPSELKEAQKNGRKIVGYFPGNYVPEEIIYATGAISLCLIHGGNPDPANAALTQVPSIICPYARTQIGERYLKTNPFYSMLDMLIAPITCQHLKKTAEVWEYYADIDLFKLGVPHQYETDFGLEYYTDRLKVMADRLNTLTGNKVTDEKLSEAIVLYNKIREQFRKLNQLRQAQNPPISSLEFVKLNHISFYIDPHVTLSLLENIYKEAQHRQRNVKDGALRLLLIGPNLAYGDYKVLELVENAGGEIVAEELCEGLQYFWRDIDTTGDPLQALAKGYLQNRVPCAFFRNSARKRLDFALDLVKDYNAAGVIWYELLDCETYDSESYFFSLKMEEQKIPMLILEADYGTGDIGQLKIRIEAFVEQVKGAGSYA